MDIGKLIKLPKDSNYILFNTIYHNKIDSVDGVDDAITLIFKNMDTGEKIIRTIDNPQIEVNIVKDGVPLDNYNHIDIDIEDVEQVDISYKNMMHDIAKITNNMDYFWSCVRERRFRDLDRVELNNKLFFPVTNIEDFYRIKVLEYLGVKELNNTTKGFLDIEADIRKGNIDFKTGTGTAPINAITLIDGNGKTSYTVALRDKDNPLIEDTEKRKDELIKKAKEMNKEFVELDYKIAFFDTELELIETIFQIINYLKLDFIVIWNIAYDIPYIIDRIIANGADPEMIMCHPDFRYKYCKYFSDHKNYEIKKKTDHFKLTSYTVFMCQMINYASVRKANSQFDSYRLDYIGGLEVGANKLDYSDVCSHIKDFPYTDYFLFLLYNIRDVVVQYAIETKVMDLDTVLYRSYESSTRFDKVFKEITFLTNVAYKEFKIQGVILGTNVNAINYNRENNDIANNEDDNLLVNSDKSKKEKFKGAIVGDSLLILPNGIPIIGKRKSSSLFRFVVDYDFTSLYPSILELMNIYKKSLIGQIRLVDETPNLLEQKIITDKSYKRGAKFVEDIEIKEPLFLGERWFGLPGPSGVAKELDLSFEDKDKYHMIRLLHEDEEIIDVKTIKVKKVE